MPNKKQQDNTKYLHFRSRSLNFGSRAFQTLKITMLYSKEDWEKVSNASSELGYSPEDLIQKTLEWASETGTPHAKIASLEDRRRLSTEHTTFSENFSRYLIYAHLTVLAGSVAIEFLLDGSKYYLAFYAAYLVSLSMALLSWMGLNLKRVLDSRKLEHMREENKWNVQIQLAHISDKLATISAIIFGVTVVLRIVVGVVTLISSIIWA